MLTHICFTRTSKFGRGLLFLTFGSNCASIFFKLFLFLRTSLITINVFRIRSLSSSTVWRYFWSLESETKSCNFLQNRASKNNFKILKPICAVDKIHFHTCEVKARLLLPLFLTFGQFEPRSYKKMHVLRFLGKPL